MNATLVSADDHIDLCYIPPAMWQERVPQRFRAPSTMATLSGRRAAAAAKYSCRVLSFHRPWARKRAACSRDVSGRSSAILV